MPYNPYDELDCLLLYFLHSAIEKYLRNANILLQHYEYGCCKLDC